MIAGILLAAGNSTRFGADKLLYPLSDGTPIALAAVRPLIEVLPDSVAVLRPDARRLSEVLATAGMRIVVNDQAERGMGLSLSCGIAATAEADGWVIALADMPFIRIATIRAVVQTLEQGAGLAAPVYYARRGHPVGFGAAFRDELLGLEGDVGARGLIARHAGRLRSIEIEDPGVVEDIDTPADLIPRR